MFPVEQSCCVVFLFQRGKLLRRDPDFWLFLAVGEIFLERIDPLNAPNAVRITVQAILKFRPCGEKLIRPLAQDLERNIARVSLQFVHVNFQREI